MPPPTAAAIVDRGRAARASSPADAELLAQAAGGAGGGVLAPARVGAAGVRPEAGRVVLAERPPLDQRPRAVQHEDRDRRMPAGRGGATSSLSTGDQPAVDPGGNRLCHAGACSPAGAAGASSFAESVDGPGCDIVLECRHGPKVDFCPRVGRSTVGGRRRRGRWRRRERRWTTTPCSASSSRRSARRATTASSPSSSGCSGDFPRARRYVGDRAVRRHRLVLERLSRHGPAPEGARRDARGDRPLRRRRRRHPQHLRHHPRARAARARARRPARQGGGAALHLGLRLELGDARHARRAGCPAA